MTTQIEEPLVINHAYFYLLKPPMTTEQVTIKTVVFGKIDYRLDPQTEGFKSNEMTIPFHAATGDENF